LNRIIAQQRPAIIHTHNARGNILGRLAAAWRHVPCVAHIHGAEGPAGKWWYGPSHRWLARYGPVITCSQRQAEAYYQATGVRARVLYNGVDLARFDRADDGSAFRAELGLSEGEDLVTTVGGLWHVKNPLCLLRAARRVLRDMPATHFVFAGRGPLQEELASNAAEWGIADRVHLLGPRDDVPAILAATSVFAFPSLHEGLPLALMEAMAAGKPVVATDVVGNNELVVPEETGFLAPSDDDAKLAESILTLLRDRALATAMGQRGRRRIEAGFTLEQMGQAIAALYHELLPPAGTSP